MRDASYGPWTGKNLCILDVDPVEGNSQKILCHAGQCIPHCRQQSHFQITVFKDMVLQAVRAASAASEL